MLLFHPSSNLPCAFRDALLTKKCRLSGFFGGVLTTDLDGDGTDDDPQDNGFVEGQLMTFRVERRGAVFSFYASEMRVHRYSSEAQVTSIGFRPHRATFDIYDWQLHRHT